MTAPKTVSDFAREYEYTFLANTQLNATVLALRDESAQIKRENADLRNENGRLQRELEAERTKVIIHTS